MSIDMSEFYQVFFEEAAELLGDMETRLLDLDIANPSKDDLDAIFRVAHSIKGGAATFGFADMAAVTHVLESLLDRLRNRELVLQADMIDAFLQAGDVVKSQLAGHRGEGEPDVALAETVCERLKMLAMGETSNAASVAELPAELANVDTVQQAPVSEVAKRAFAVAFVFDGNAAALANLYANLQALGEVEFISGPSTEQLQPKAAPIENGKCVLRIATAVAEDELWEALAFVVDPSHIKIQALQESVAASVTPSSDGSAGEHVQGYGFFEPLYQAVTATPPAAVTPSPVERLVEVAKPQAAEPPAKRDTEKGPNASADTTSIRVNTEKVDQLINLVGELVITQAMLVQAASKVDPTVHDALLKGMGQLDRNTRDLQESVMSIRMMPISFVFSRYPRLVRDMAGKLNKEVELKTVGESTELDKGLIEKIADPLTHLVRNSLDHGIEPPDKRQAAGKPAKGTISLRAFHQGGNVVIEVSDDGAGLDRDKILAKAKAQGLAVSDSMPDQDVWMLIFEAGFSTAEVVTDVSGRGVGMDVVRRNIHALGGSVEIDSALGYGTRMSIRLPLTLAIVDGLSVAVGEQTFIVPLTYIIESLQPRAADIQSVGRHDSVLHVRGEYLPILRAHDYFGIPTPSNDLSQGIIVILEADGAKKALFVDALLGQNQVVIKSLESNYRRVRGVSGATIMGDGTVGLIMDVNAVVRGNPREQSAQVADLRSAA